MKKDAVVTQLKNKVTEMWGEKHWIAFVNLMSGESGFDPWVVNQKSFACGLFQSLPCSKIGGKVYWNQELNKWRLDPESAPVEKQIEWGMNYIKQRYSNPIQALSFWLNQSPHWY